MVYVSHGYDTKMQYGRIINIGEMDWITVDPFSEDGFRHDGDSLKVSFKTRHTPEFFDGILYRLTDGNYRLESDKDIQGIAPGQYAIIYTPDRRICLGSGMISR